MPACRWTSNGSFRRAIAVGPLRYPVPTRLTVAGIMNYVYEKDYAVLVRLKVPAGASGTVPIRAIGALARVHRQGLRAGAGRVRARCAGRRGPANRSPAVRRVAQGAAAAAGYAGERFAIAGNTLRVAIPLPRSVAVEKPYFFPAADGPVDYAGEQRFRRLDDMLIAELPRRSGEPQQFAGVLAYGDGKGLEVRASPGDVPKGGHAIGDTGARGDPAGRCSARSLGGLLLNLMPCVFPILALKALHLAKSGGDERAGTARRARLCGGRDHRDRRAGRGAARNPSGRDGDRLGVPAAGPAHHPACCSLLTTAITLNLLRGCSKCRRSRSKRFPAAASAPARWRRSSRRPAPGPFLGAALGTALLLPPAGSVAVFAALGLGSRAAVRCGRFHSSASHAACPSPALDGAPAAIPRHPDGRDGARLPVAAVAARRRDGAADRPRRHRGRRHCCSSARASSSAGGI